jgi:hypothetical protein
MDSGNASNTASGTAPHTTRRSALTFSPYDNGPVTLKGRTTAA